LWWVVEENLLDNRGNYVTSRFVRYIRIHASAVIAWFTWVLCLCLLDTGSASGFPPPRYHNTAERVLGTIGFLAALQPGRDADDATGIIIEAGSMRLFGVPEFGEDGMRVSFLRRSLALSLCGAVTSSPVGSEHAAGISLRMQTATFITIGMRLDGAVTSLETCERSTMLTTSSFVSMQVAQGVSVGWMAEGLHLHGEALRGVDISMCAAAHITGTVTATTTVAIDRWGEVSMGYAASLHVRTFFNAWIGYEGACEQVKTGIGLSGTSWTCEVCVLVHPVLGLSKGFFLQWRH
jgi:hypothetical protein